MSSATPRTVPTLELETELARAGHRFVAGMDEVGRGALAGPASVGLAVLDLERMAGGAPSDPPPWHGVRDSKALSPARRAALAPTIAAWAAGTAVGHAQPREIDELGINAALRLAGLRALKAVRAAGVPVDALILDGSYNWLNAPAVLGQAEDPVELPAVVHTLVKADAQCVSVAAASILAKVERDALMTALPDPGYAWAANKGYASAAHVDGLARLGASEQHRRSWRLPGVDRFTAG